MIHSVEIEKNVKERVWIQDIFFFVLFFIYIWFYIEPRLIFHGGWYTQIFPVFYTDWSFFKDHLSYAGGFVEYGSALLSQFLYYSWAGACVITFQAWLIFVCTNSFLKALIAPKLKWLRFIPPIVFLILYSQYAFYFTTMMALAVALVFVCFYVKMNFKNKVLDLIILLILSIILYALVGGAYIIFSLLCAMYGLLSKRRWEMILCCLLLSFIVPYIEGVNIYGMSSIDAFGRLTPISWEIQRYKTTGMIFIYCLYLFLPLITIGLLIWRRFGYRLILPIFMRSTFKISILKNKKLKWIFDTCLLFMVTIASIYFSYNNKLKTILAVDYFAYHRMWPQVLEAAKGSPQNDLVMAAVNRALYHTGQLGNAEIVLQQRPSTFFLNEKIYEHAFWFKFDIFLDLGYVNKAEHQLVEGLDYYGERPQLLQRLALVNMVKNNLGTARIYLGALSKMLFYSNWANEYLNEIDLDTTLSMNQQVQSLRQIMMDQDRTSDENVGGYLLDLLNKNRNNQMAFEYLMTLDILRKDLKGVVSNIDRFNDFNYSPIPRLYEEAILLCSIVPSLKDNLRGKKLTISAESIQLAKDFNKALRVFNGDREATLRGLPVSLRNNYFFYCMSH
jgi:hypothetical protein